MTTEQAKVPKTIQTRCVHVQLQPVDEDSIWDICAAVAEAEGLEVSDSELDRIARDAGGSVRRGLAMLLEDKTSQEVEAEAIELARALMNPNPKEIFGVLNKLPENCAESVRRVIMSYMSKVVCSNGSAGKNISVPGSVMLAFSESYDDDSKVNLVTSVLRFLTDE